MPISIKAYLQAQGFWEHPFATTSAEREREFLSSFFVRPHYFDWLVGEPERPESLILFAPVGFGKTSQRIELARELRQRRNPALVVSLDDFGGLLAAPGAPVSLDVYIDLIRRMTLETLDDLLAHNHFRAELLRRKAPAEAMLHMLLSLY
ncbi:MAG: hypothetical protein HGA45_33760, partial [Chloroflexales bacterium]|nr:hypothetical protein [Chloroflexales bacterium]